MVQCPTAEYKVWSINFEIHCQERYNVNTTMETILFSPASSPKKSIFGDDRQQSFKNLQWHDVVLWNDLMRLPALFSKVLA